MELRVAAVQRVRQCLRRRAARGRVSRHVLSERPRKRGIGARGKLMSIVAVPRVAVVAFAVVYATMLANEAKAQSRAPRQETLPQLVRFCPRACFGLIESAGFPKVYG